MGIVRGVIVLGLLLAAAFPAVAEDLSGTLEKIRDAGVVTLGFRESSYPLSHLDGEQRPVGYHIDVCQRIVAAIRTRLDLPGLAVEFQPVTSQNRIPLLTNGTIDLECGSTTNNEARARQVAFAPTTFVTSVRMAVRRDSGVSRLAQLQGRRVVTTTGTTSIQLIRAHRRGRSLEVRELYGKDHADSFLMLETGRADAFVMDDNLLAGLIATSKNPDDYAIVGEVLDVEPIAIMLRRDDPAFKALVDDTVKGLMRSGELERLYTKWFLSPIPPRMVNLHLAMSPQLKAMIERPSDAPAEAIGATTYRWNWGIYFETVPGGDERYLDWLLSGLGWTLAVSLAAWVLALAIGIPIGALRTVRRRWVAGLATAYVEVFRNIPLLVQLFLWFFVAPELLPEEFGRWIKQDLPAKEFVTAALCLGLFTAARIAELVRTGIEGQARGQRMAAQALGFTALQTYRLVLLPMALRRTMPPLTSEFMNIIKNSSVAFAIGVIELTFVARQMQEESEQGIETYLAVTVLYFVAAFLANRVMAVIERRVRIPGGIGGGR